MLGSLANFSWKRSVTSYAKVQTTLGNLIRNRQFQLRRDRLRGLAYLDLGCGPNTHADFVNLDYLWHTGIDVCWDVARGLPFPDGRFRGIFSEHCLEHFPLPAAAKLLSEVRRVLAPGGIVRIIVPDGELYLRTYVEQREGRTAVRFPFQDQEAKEELWTPMWSVNRVFYQDRDSPFGHRVIYDALLLEGLLRKCGFTWVQRCAFRQGRDAGLLVDTPARQTESLYLEAGYEAG